MKKSKSMIALFILPCALCLLLMFLYPVIRTVIMSFFQVESLTSAVSSWSFYGLGNYIKIFNSNSFLIGGVITLALSMLIAVVLTSGIRGSKFFRAAIYLPNIVSAVALATMWVQYVFNYDYGLLNNHHVGAVRLQL